MYPGDKITIPFGLLNLNGFVDPTSVKCMLPQYVNLKENIKDFTQYNRDKQYQSPLDIVGMKILCDVDRICEVEDQVTEWHHYGNTNARQPPVRLHGLQNFFFVQDILFNESDLCYQKLVLRARKDTL